MQFRVLSYLLYLGIISYSWDLCTVQADKNVEYGNPAAAKAPPVSDLDIDVFEKGDNADISAVVDGNPDLEAQLQKLKQSLSIGGEAHMYAVMIPVSGEEGPKRKPKNNKKYKTKYHTFSRNPNYARAQHHLNQTDNDSYKK